MPQRTAQKYGACPYAGTACRLLATCAAVRSGDADDGGLVAALAALDAAVSLLGVARSSLLYARADVVTGVDGAPPLLELGLAEPSLGFGQADAGAPGSFATAVRDLL